MRTVRCSSRLLRGVSTKGGFLLGQGVYPGGVCLPLVNGGFGVCGGAGGGVVVCPGSTGGCLPDPPVDRMTDRCKNVTLPQ